LFVQACLKSKAPDTSAAWKSEAEKAAALLAEVKKERDLAVRVGLFPHFTSTGKVFSE
jgi:hypothetical protein